MKRYIGGLLIVVSCFTSLAARVVTGKDVKLCHVSADSATIVVRTQKENAYKVVIPDGFDDYVRVAYDVESLMIVQEDKGESAFSLSPEGGDVLVEAKEELMPAIEVFIPVAAIFSCTLRTSAWCLLENAQESIVFMGSEGAVTATNCHDVLVTGVLGRGGSFASEGETHLCNVSGDKDASIYVRDCYEWKDKDEFKRYRCFKIAPRFAQTDRGVGLHDLFKEHLSLRMRGNGEAAMHDLMWYALTYEKDVGSHFLQLAKRHMEMVDDRGFVVTPQKVKNWFAPAVVSSCFFLTLALFWAKRGERAQGRGGKILSTLLGTAGAFFALCSFTEHQIGKEERTKLWEQLKEFADRCSDDAMGSCAATFKEHVAALDKMDVNTAGFNERFSQFYAWTAAQG